MSSLPPRAVVVTRPTELEELIQRHGTREAARFFLTTRDRHIEDVEAAHHEVRAAVMAVLAAIHVSWRRALVARADLDRFSFEPEDVVVAVGQDGLVANTAKYLSGQIVVGINPLPRRYDGVLVRHAPAHAAELLECAAQAEGHVEVRTLVEALTSDGQRLRALNEIFVGHRSHQSARYSIACGGGRERHSSSGLIVATGTGATGWARSIHRGRRTEVVLPEPSSRTLAYFVREAFPSVATGVGIADGILEPGQALHVVSEMNEGGVIFGDGIEDDRIDFHFGQSVRIAAADQTLRLLAA
jgi:NAD kinase